VSVDPRRDAYARAFIAQARSDWEVRGALAARSELPRCHQLHYLQMACEKLAKAYRLVETESPLEELVSKHTGFDKFVGAFFFRLKKEYHGKDQQLQALIRRSRTFAREIEKLAPAIDRKAAPENAEYPWERDGTVVAPRDHAFPSLDFVRDPGGRAFLKLVERALDDFEKLTTR
jgi:hypothetical protein